MRTKRRYTGWKPERVVELRRLYADGLNPDAIAEQMKLTRMVVTNRLRAEWRGDHGDPLPRRTKRPRPERAPPPPVEPGPPAASAGWMTGASADLLRVALAEGLGVGVEHGQVIEVLLRYLGEPLSMAQLQGALGKHRTVKRQAVYERVRFLRQVMGKDAIGGWRDAQHRFIANPRELGSSDYYLTDQGVARCREALARVATLLPLRQVDLSPPLRTDAEAAD